MAIPVLGPVRFSSSSLQAARTRGDAAIATIAIRRVILVMSGLLAHCLVYKIGHVFGNVKVLNRF